MKTLRDFEDLIRSEVKKINEKDTNWRWSVRSFGKYRVMIRWSYLDYCEEKNNCFILRLADYDKDFNDYFLSARTPHDDMIEGHIISEICDKSWQESFENAIKFSIQEIADYAHSRY